MFSFDCVDDTRERARQRGYTVEQKSQEETEEGRGTATTSLKLNRVDDWKLTQRGDEDERVWNQHGLKHTQPPSPLLFFFLFVSEEEEEEEEKETTPTNGRQLSCTRIFFFLFLSPVASTNSNNIFFFFSVYVAYAVLVPCRGTKRNTHTPTEHWSQVNE